MLILGSLLPHHSYSFPLSYTTRRNKMEDTAD